MEDEFEKDGKGHNPLYYSEAGTERPKLASGDTVMRRFEGMPDEEFQAIFIKIYVRLLNNEEMTAGSFDLPNTGFISLLSRLGLITNAEGYTMYIKTVLKQIRRVIKFSKEGNVTEMLSAMSLAVEQLTQSSMTPIALDMIPEIDMDNLIVISESIDSITWGWDKNFSENFANLRNAYDNLLIRMGLIKEIPVDFSENTKIILRKRRNNIYTLDVSCSAESYKSPETPNPLYLAVRQDTPGKYFMIFQSDRKHNAVEQLYNAIPEHLRPNFINLFMSEIVPVISEFHGMSSEDIVQMVPSGAVNHTFFRDYTTHIREATDIDYMANIAYIPIDSWMDFNITGVENRMSFLSTAYYTRIRGSFSMTCSKSHTIEHVYLSIFNYYNYVLPMITMLEKKLSDFRPENEISEKAAKHVREFLRISAREVGKDFLESRDLYNKFRIFDLTNQDTPVTETQVLLCALKFMFDYIGSDSLYVYGYTTSRQAVNVIYNFYDYFDKHGITIPLKWETEILGFLRTMSEDHLDRILSGKYLNHVSSYLYAAADRITKRGSSLLKDITNKNSRDTIVDINELVQYTASTEDLISNNPNLLLKKSVKTILAGDPTDDGGFKLIYDGYYYHWDPECENIGKDPRETTSAALREERAILGRVCNICKTPKVEDWPRIEAEAHGIPYVEEPEPEEKAPEVEIPDDLKPLVKRDEGHGGFELVYDSSLDTPVLHLNARCPKLSRVAMNMEFTSSRTCKQELGTFKLCTECGCTPSEEIWPKLEEWLRSKKDISGDRSGDSDDVIRESVKNGKVAEIVLEDNTLKAYDVIYSPDYIPGNISQDKSPKKVSDYDLRMQYGNEQLVVLAKWIEEHPVGGSYIRFRIIRDTPALDWYYHMDYSTAAHAGKRDKVIYIGEHLLSYILLPENEGLMREVLDKDEYRHIFESDFRHTSGDPDYNNRRRMVNNAISGIQMHLSSEDLSKLAGTNIAANVKNGNVYVIYYNEDKFAEYEKLLGFSKDITLKNVLDVYVEAIRMRTADGNGNHIIVKKTSNRNKDHAQFISVYRYEARGSDSPLGEGHIDLAGNLRGHALNLIAMLNMVMAASDIPANAYSEGNLDGYADIVEFINRSYKHITGRDIGKDSIQNIILDLPDIAPIPANEIEDYYRKMIEKIRQSA